MEIRALSKATIDAAVCQAESPSQFGHRSDGPAAV